MNNGDSLQAYFEQQNDKEAASIVAAVIALLPSNNSVISWEGEKKDDDEEHQQEEDDSINAADNVLNNILLTKESEISALKEVIIKWRNRAFEAESNARVYYLEQLQIIELQHEYELKAMESRYTRKLYERDDIILTLKDQVDYLICNKHQDGDTESFVSTIDQEEDDDDTHSVISSIYDREVEQRLVVVENRPNNSVKAPSELKSENILDSIQVTMHAIEQELSFHHTTTNDDNSSIMTTESIQYNNNTTRRHRRSPTYNSTNTYYSSATLCDSENNNTTPTINKKIKKSSFFINRIFKKAFPKLYKKHINNNNNNSNINTISPMNLKYTKSLPLNQLQYQKKKRNHTASATASSIRYHHHSNMGSSILYDNGSSTFPRSSTDETLGVYSTTNSSQLDYQKPVNVLDLLPAMNNNTITTTVV